MQENNFQGRFGLQKIAFTRAPHQAGRSLQQTMNPHFFFLLAPRLPHVVQGTEKNGNSGCAAEVHHGRVGEESSGGVQLSHGARFLWTAHLDANDIAVRPDHFVLGAGRSPRRDRPGSASNYTSLTCSWSFKMKRCSSCRLSEHRNAVAVGLLLLLRRGEGVPYTFLKRRHLSRPPPLSRKTRRKKK